MNLYEGMFLLDNNVVREDWSDAKGTATGILEKHGAAVTTARRWAERSLAYTIKKRNRGTYLLVHFEADPESISIVRRDLELNEAVMRYLILKSDGIPEGEQELHEAELSAEYSVPEPPEDHVVDVPENEEGEEGSSQKRADGGAKPAAGDAKPAEGGAKPADGDAKSAAGDAKSAAGDAKSAAGDAKSAAGDAKPAEPAAPAEEVTSTTEETKADGADAPAADEASSEGGDAPAAEAAASEGNETSEGEAEAKTSEEG
jgi:small subunit ribosomal protein S6